MKFLYFNTYIKGDTDEQSIAIEDHVEVYAAADKYQIKDLKELAVTNVRKWLCGNTMDESRLLSVAHLVFEKTVSASDPLRKEIAHSLFVKLDASREESQQRRAVEQFLNANPEIATAMTMVGMEYWTEKRMSIFLPPPAYDPRYPAAASPTLPWAPRAGGTSMAATPPVPAWTGFSPWVMGPSFYLTECSQWFCPGIPIGPKPRLPPQGDSGRVHGPHNP